MRPACLPSLSSSPLCLLQENCTSSYPHSIRSEWCTIKSMKDVNTQGAIPSPIDYRDTIALASAMPQQPISIPPMLDTQLGPVMMQAKIPACVSFDIVDMMKLYWFRKTGKWVDFSPRFLDILSNEPDIPLDGGRRPRTVLKVAVSKGCAIPRSERDHTGGASGSCAVQDPRLHQRGCRIQCDTPSALPLRHAVHPFRDWGLAVEPLMGSKRHRTASNSLSSTLAPPNGAKGLQ